MKVEIEGMSREKIQDTINRVKELFDWGEIAHATVVSKLDEDLWREFAEKNGYDY